jgi:O-antigen/teichoic acid export membrane protein
VSISSFLRRPRRAPVPSEAGYTPRARNLLSNLRKRIVKGELFASTFSYAASAAMRLGSSLVLTRLLTPEAYGIFGILFSFLFIVELVSDVGSASLLIRHARGQEREFIHTVWTIRLIRSVINCLIIFFGAPLAAHIYGLPQLIDPLRLMSVMFLISGAESMSYTLAQRDRKARISNYADLFANAAMTVCVIVIAFYIRNVYALILGALCRKVLIMASSHFLYREVGVGLAFDREAIREQFRFARYVMPSSILTIVLSQYDKILLLKLTDLALVGIYTIAGNVVAPTSGIINHNARAVLYPRCAEYFRTNRATVRSRYYAENKKLLAVGVLIPALIAGFANLFVQVLYDARYSQAGHILMVLALGVVVFAFVSASENMLVASGKNHYTLASNAIWLACAIPASLIGFYAFGFEGFLWFNLAARLPSLFYFYYEQRRFGLVSFKSEFRLLIMALGLFLCGLVVSQILLSVLPPAWLHLRFHK